MDEQEVGRRIEIGTKLTEGNSFVVLGKVELQVISITDGQTLEVESSLWCLSCHQHQLLCLPCWLYCHKEVHWFPEGEQWGVKFGNGCETYTSGDAGRHITALSLDGGKNSQRTTTELLVHLDGTLKEMRVAVEDVTGVSLTLGRTAEEGYLTVSNSLLGQIIVDNQSWKE